MKPACSLWVVRAPAAPRSDHLALLTPGERTICERFRQAERQARYACGRFLLRHALAARLGGAPGDFDIAPGRHRRPGLGGDSALAYPDVDFNLSSTRGYVACAVATGLRVGVDIEAPARHGGRGVDDDSVGELVFSPEEREWVTRQVDGEDRFYRLWTLKEAIAKADGEGLGLPFDRLRVLPAEDGTLTTDLSALEAGRDRWRVFSLEADVPAALALIGASAGDPEPDFSPSLPEAAGLERVPVRLLARTA